MNPRPIGIFDSGIGGTTIWREIHRLLPWEDTLYLADSKNAPYGERSKEEILRLSIKNTEFLLGKGCKLIVVACNTATTNAISYLRNNYKVPFIGIEPAIKPAALNSKSKKVGILATKGTLASELFHYTAENHANGITVLECIGTGLVPLIEAGKLGSPDTRALLYRLLGPMLEEGIDYLVLGCTHYPYLIPALREILPADVVILDSGLAVARQTETVLRQNGLLNSLHSPVAHGFYTNADVGILRYFLNDIKVDYTAEFLEF
ncbi:glutamate racemase [Flavobacteriaceae bacterium F89]|uniref:Glutamate racemase n=1 Tax=Cerina litoralis TaxID=2874477 RepID=A0AAE3JPB5_9FLAO|nr:glutamate racemase [Cerina litoralis]MCG2460589.1 glutamate racemase [Cerina litoralis]